MGGLSAQASMMTRLHPVRAARVSFRVPGRLTSMTELQLVVLILPTEDQGACGTHPKDEHWRLRENLFHGQILRTFKIGKTFHSEFVSYRTDSGCTP